MALPGSDLFRRDLPFDLPLFVLSDMETFRFGFSSLGLVVPESRPRSSFPIISLKDSSENENLTIVHPCLTSVFLPCG